MIVFPVLAVVLLVTAGVLLCVAASTRRARSAQLTALLLSAGALLFCGAWMFGLI